MEYVLSSVHEKAGPGFVGELAGGRGKIGRSPHWRHWRQRPKECMSEPFIRGGPLHLSNLDRRIETGPSVAPFDSKIVCVPIPSRVNSAD
jgi:hypothetical protein